MLKPEDKMEKGTSGAAAYVGVVRAMLGLTDHVICGSGDIKAIVFKYATRLLKLQVLQTACQFPYKEDSQRKDATIMAFRLSAPRSDA